MNKYLLLFLLTTSLQALEILNVSYDPTREFYDEYNELFKKHWGEEIEIKQSHGGSGKQARGVIEGLEADVVTLALAYDIDRIADHQLIDPDWQKRLPHNSSPYTSTIVFLVRKGNPKNIHDWLDLIRPDIEVITPNPKTSGGARWNYLAAYAFAKEHFKNDEKQIVEYMKALFSRVPVLDAGARASTITFTRRGIGDVLLTWENEVYQAKKALGDDVFEVINPSISILTEPPVSIVDAVVKKKGTEKVADAYLRYLYTPEAQRLIAKFYYRPQDPAVAKEFASQFPNIKMITIQELGGWRKMQKEHFDDGGLFDKISTH